MDNFERILDENTGVYVWRPGKFSDTTPIESGEVEPSAPEGGNEPQEKAEAEFKAHEFIIEGSAEATFPNPHIKGGLGITFTNLGSNFSGLYKVDTATHTINAVTGYTLKLDVTRNATGLKILGEKRPTDISTRPSKPVVEPENREEVKYHTITEKDTLWDISKKFYGDGSLYMKIAEANNLSNPNKLKPGQKLIIP